MHAGSVAYDNLPGVFIVFGIWNENNCLISWDETEEWCDLFGLPHVPVIYRGTDYNEAVETWFKKHNSDSSEGFVVRNAGEFAYEDFNKNVSKWVRKGHVRTSADWRHRKDFAVNTFKNSRTPRSSQK